MVGLSSGRERKKRARSARCKQSARIHDYRLQIDNCNRKGLSHAGAIKDAITDGPNDVSRERRHVWLEHTSIAYR